MLVISLFVGCSKYEVDYPTDHRFVELLTVIENDKGMRLEKVGINDSESIMLTTDQYVDVPLERGRRVIAEYGVADTDLSRRPMPVRLHQMGLIEFDTIRAVSYEKMADLADSRMKLVSVWRTGQFINLQAKVEYDGEKRSFTIVADESTLSNPIVECYLCNSGSEVSATVIDRHAYGSFFMGDLWNRPTLERVRLYLNSASEENSFVDIVKNSH